MSTLTAPHFVCPACARKNVWKEAIAGKRAKCACGTVIAVPSFAPAIAVPPAVAPPAARAARSAPKPFSNSAMAGIPYRKGLQPEPPPAPAVIPPHIRDIVLPIVLIAAGIYAAGTDAMQGSGGHPLQLSQVIGPLILNVVIGLSLAVTAVLGGAIMAGIAFDGPLWQNIMKLCAVALLPLPMGSMAGRSIGGINGDIVSSFVSIAFYFALFWAVFKMAWSDRTVCVMMIWIIRSGVAYLLFKMGGTMKGSSI